MAEAQPQVFEAAGGMSGRELAGVYVRAVGPCSEDLGVVLVLLWLAVIYPCSYEVASSEGGSGPTMTGI